MTFHIGRGRLERLIGSGSMDVVWAEDAGLSCDELRPGQPYLVTEHAHGRPLFPLCGRLSWPQAEAVLVDLLGALAHAHAREVLHRDIKPSNVLAAVPRNSRAGIKLTDFGLARRAFDDSKLNVVGTPLLPLRGQGRPARPARPARPSARSGRCRPGPRRGTARRPLPHGSWGGCRPLTGAVSSTAAVSPRTRCPAAPGRPCRRGRPWPRPGA